MRSTKLTGTIAFLSIVAFAAAPSALAQCSSGVAKSAGYSKNIVETAVAAGQFNTLATALKAAGLVDALQGDGPFTVFAPTDEAFAKLPAGTVESLLKPENKDQLVAVLTYHVVAGNYGAKSVTSRSGAQALNGQWLDFSMSQKDVMVDAAKVVKPDVHASNGVIHVIDTVMLPSTDNIVTTAKSAKAFNTLLTAATEAGLADTLANGGPFTVFAPTDEAFAKLPAGTLANLLKPENREQLRTILKYHVVSGRVYSPDALTAGSAKTLANQDVRIAKRGDEVKINDARIIQTDIDASNGVIHVIDAVILPSS